MQADYRVKKIFVDDITGDIIADCYDVLYGESFEKFLGNPEEFDGRENASNLLQDSNYDISDELRREIESTFGVREFIDDQDYDSYQFYDFGDDDWDEEDEIDELVYAGNANGISTEDEEEFAIPTRFLKRESFNLREALNQIDLNTYNKYDLLNLYESCNLSENEKRALANIVYDQNDPSVIYDTLNNRFLGKEIEMPERVKDGVIHEDSDGNEVYGSWSVDFDITFEGEETSFDNLSETTQEHIAESIKEGYAQGEIVEEEGTGWWVAKIECYLDNEGDVLFDSLDEPSQEHIADSIKDGYTSGELCVWVDGGIDEAKSINEDINKSLASRLVDFIKDYDFYHYSDTLEVGDTEEDAIKEMDRELDNPKSAKSLLDSLIKMSKEDNLDDEQKNIVSSLIAGVKSVVNKNQKVNESVKKSLTEGFYRGCKDITMIGHGAWSDPELEYNGYLFNYWDIEDALWDGFLDETGYSDAQSDDPKVEEEFNTYVKERCVDYLEDCIYGGAFTGLSIEGDIVDFPNGDYYYVGYEDGKISLDNAYNTGRTPEYSIDYDFEESIDTNLQKLYDHAIEKSPWLNGDDDDIDESVEDDLGDDELNAFYKGYTEEDEDENSAYNRLKNNQTDEAYNKLIESAELSTDQAVMSTVDQIKMAYEAGLFDKLPIGRKNAATTSIYGPDKERLVGYFKKQPEFNYEMNTEGGIMSHEFISDKLDIEIFDEFISIYRIPQNESVEKVYTKKNGDYLVKGDNGGYQAFSKDDVHLGHIDEEDPQEAQFKFDKNQFTESKSIKEDVNYDDEEQYAYVVHFDEDGQNMDNWFYADEKEKAIKYAKENLIYGPVLYEIDEDGIEDAIDYFFDDEIDESKSIRESEEDKPYTKEEVERDLKSLTHNFTDKEGDLKCGFEEEKKFGVEILRQHYKIVEVSGDDRREGTWYHISFAEPKNLNDEPIKISFNSKMKEIDIEDKSEVGADGHPIDRLSNYSSGKLK